jgi:copper ion binding protein
MCTSCNCGDSKSDVVLGVESLTTRAPEVFEVEGMTCGHCVGSVSNSVGQVDGVRKVSVDLATGRLEVQSDRGVSRESIDSAVRAAGYTLR